MRRKTTLACAVLLVLLVCSVIPQAVPAAAHGDFNGDGKISSQDAVWMLRHVLEPQDGAADQASDFNGDGRVDTQDALYLLRYALRPEAYPLVENHDPVELPGKAATCTEPGLMAGMICRVCEKVLQEQTELPALGHSYEQGVCTRCGELKEIVTLAEEVVFCGSTIVHDCRNLETVCFSGDPVRWTRDGFYLDDGVRLLLNYGHDYAGEILCPESCTDTELVIPGTHQGLPVREIGDYAFSGCSGLESITIPEGVTAIGVAAFSRCSDLALLLAVWTMSIAHILKMEQHEIRRIDVGKCLRRRHDGMPAAGSGAIFAVSV